MRAYIFNWVKLLAAYFIFMTMVLNFLPEGQYRKYVRYFFSLLLLILLCKPLGDLTGLADRLSESLDTMLYEEEYRESLGAGLYVGEDGQKLVEEACQEKIREQAEEMLAEYDLYLVECVSDVDLSEDSPGIRSLYVRASARTGEEQSDRGQIRPDQDFGRAEEIRKKLMAIYELPERQVTVVVQEPG